MTDAQTYDKYELYELVAQVPDQQARFIRAVHGHAPRTLGEDFSGTGAISKAWVAHDADARAVAVDHDAEPLARLRGADRVTVHQADVLSVADPADAIIAFNYSICELHERSQLVAYLAHVRSRLAEHGCFICDIYGGSDALMPNRLEQTRKLPTGEKLRYMWEQRLGDPITGRVENAMHFLIKPKRARPIELADAFVYDWRLWTVPELRDAMHEAGFASVDVYDRLGTAADEDGNLYAQPISEDDPIDANFVVYLAARC